jgi:hypothetical protein
LKKLLKAFSSLIEFVLGHFKNKIFTWQNRYIMIGIFYWLIQCIKLRKSFFNKPFVLITFKFNIKVYSTWIRLILFIRRDSYFYWWYKVIVAHWNRYYCKYIIFYNLIIFITFCKNYKNMLKQLFNICFT